MWHGVLFVRTGVYRGAVWKFKLVAADAHPADCAPTVVFYPPLPFHPLVHPKSGILDLSGFEPWDVDRHSLADVLTFLKAVFYNKFTSSSAPLNTHAAQLFSSAQSEFLLKAAESAAATPAAAYTAPEEAFAIAFSEPSPQHEEVRSAVLRVDAASRAALASAGALPAPAGLSAPRAPSSMP